MRTHAKVWTPQEIDTLALKGMTKRQERNHFLVQERDLPAPNKAQHSPECSSNPDSKASKILGQCYCDCGAEDREWRLWEEIDGSTSVYPVGVDPDDLAFGRAKPLCVIPEGKFHVAKLIVASVNHAAQLAEALRECLKCHSDNAPIHAIITKALSAYEAAR